MIHNLHINTHRHQSFFGWLFCRHERYSTARQIHKCGKNSLYEINLFLSMCSAETLRKCKANEKYSGRGCHWFFWGSIMFLSTFAIFYFIAAQVEDLREAILKLAAADKLRAQGFLRSEQNLPKTNKRGVSVVVWMTAPVLCTHHMIKSSNMTKYNPTTCFYSQLRQIQHVQWLCFTSLQDV